MTGGGLQAEGKHGGNAVSPEPCDFSFSTSERVPLLAIVPRHCTSSSFDMPMPVSVTVSVRAASSHVTLICSALPEGSAPCCRSASLSFSNASLALDTISLMNTSLSEYMLKVLQLFTAGRGCNVQGARNNVQQLLRLRLERKAARGGEAVGRGARWKAAAASCSAYDSEPSAEEERGRDWKGRGEKWA